MRGTAKARKSLYASQKGICGYCRSETSFEKFTVDHVRPKSKGGSDATVNLVGACLDCNREKGHKNSTAYAAYKLGLIHKNNL